MTVAASGRAGSMLGPDRARCMVFRAAVSAEDLRVFKWLTMRPSGDRQWKPRISTREKDVQLPGITAHCHRHANVAHGASTGDHDPNDGCDAPSVHAPPAPNGGAPGNPDSSGVRSSEVPPSKRPGTADAPSSRRPRRSEDQPDTNIRPPMRSRDLGTVGFVSDHRRRRRRVVIARDANAYTDGNVRLGKQRPCREHHYWQCFTFHKVIHLPPCL